MTADKGSFLFYSFYKIAANLKIEKNYKKRNNENWKLFQNFQIWRLLISRDKNTFYKILLLYITVYLSFADSEDALDWSYC